MGNHLLKIATRTGDDSTTGLGDGGHAVKDNLRIAAVGDVDELSLYIDVLLTKTLPDGVCTALAAIRHDLFDLSGELYVPGHTMVTTAHMLRFDQWLTDYNADPPRLAEFILPDGSRVAARAHVCRTVARRAEHSIVTLGRAETIGEAPRQYINRLSDLLFVLARMLNHTDGDTDILWEHDKYKPT